MSFFVPDYRFEPGKEQPKASRPAVTLLCVCHEHHPIVARVANIPVIECPKCPTRALYLFPGIMALVTGKGDEDEWWKADALGGTVDVESSPLRPTVDGARRGKK